MTGGLTACGRKMPDLDGAYENAKAQAMALCEEEDDEWDEALFNRVCSRSKVDGWESLQFYAAGKYDTVENIFDYSWAELEEIAETENEVEIWRNGVKDTNAFFGLPESRFQEWLDRIGDGEQSFIVEEADLQINVYGKMDSGKPYMVTFKVDYRWK